MDLNYFRQVVAKMILFKAAVQLAPEDAGSLRAQAVSYAMGWLIERSGRRIDLDGIWEKQRIPEAVADALVVVCREALAYIKALPGNPTEAAKKEESWLKFKGVRVELAPSWEKSLGVRPFVAPRSDLEAVALEWECVRHRFVGDKRPIMNMAARIGRPSPLDAGGWIVGHVAALSWDELRGKPGYGPVKLRQIVSLFSLAASKL